MSKSIKNIHTNEGTTPIDYESLANLPNIPAIVTSTVEQAGYMKKDDTSYARSSTQSEAFSIEKEYNIGDYCIYENVLYKFTEAKVAGEWDSTKASPTTIDTELKAHATAINEQKHLKDLCGDEYDPKNSYAAGEYCIHDNKMQKCKTATAGTAEVPEEFDQTKWDVVTIAGELREQNVKIKPIHTITVELQFDSTGIAQYTFDHNVVILNVTGMAGDYAKQITYGRTEGFTMWSFISDPNTNIAVDMAYIDF